MSNADQAEFWSGAAGQTWVANQAAMDALLQPVLDAVLEVADLQPGARVLDIGCGTGASVANAAQLVGPEGHVTGADISPTLLALAEERLSGFSNTSLLEADAQSAALPGPFDAMISRFGVMFFNDTASAFSNIASYLRPDAPLTMAAWADVAQNPYFMTAAGAAKAVLGDMPKTDRSLPGPFAFEKPERVQRDFAAAGLTDVHIDTRNIPLTPPVDADALADLLMQIGPAGSAATKMGASTEQVADIRAELVARFTPLLAENDGAIPALIHIITARAAG